MKAKLGKLDAIKNTKYSGYQSLLKKEIIAVLKDPKAKGLCDYVLVSGQHLTWGGDSPSEDQPLLYLGQKNTWEKDLKADKKIDLKAYSYGTCKLVKVGADVQIALCPEKGKLTQDTLLKPLKKVFKSFKPKTFLEVVSDLNTVETSTSETTTLDEVEQSAKEILQTIGTDLQKYHLAIEKIKQSISKVKTEEEKMPLLVKQNQILKRIKHLCASWTTDIAPQAEQLVLDKTSETWQKIYQKWNAFFEKRQAAKTGKTQDQNAMQAEEERIYTKALGNLQQFVSNLEKGNLIDPSVIDSNISNMEEQLKKWKEFAKNKSTFPKELKLFEEKVDSIKDGWKKERSRYAAFSKAKKLINEKIEAGDFVAAQKLLDQLST
ncbi:hypothetical protein [Aureispira anguillae]|uniref:Uncharacterized protein n=1 Tax=Aureispira anguillae TaxID=2864201 RepID=A0A915YIS1_9BACT|nr:hypothetical protein [Aureispira anguillae]BDS13815.1 hypothetical protein AsAng_0045770 [Aureispira anguillae]